jgi:tetratricopeptide (TPR) repeat protein
LKIINGKLQTLKSKKTQTSTLPLTPTPKNAKFRVFIRIEIELIRINRNDPKTINVWNMDESERLESGQTTKNEADASFKSGNLDEALELYERSLKILIDDESER